MTPLHSKASKNRIYLTSTPRPWFCTTSHTARHSIRSKIAILIVRMKISYVLFPLVFAPAAAAFQLPFRHAFTSSLKATTLNPNGSVNGVKSGEKATSWDCDNEANCVEVPACDETQCRTSLDVRIHGNWYDLSGTCVFPPTRYYIYISSVRSSR